MPQVLHTLTDPVITIADTEAGLTGGDQIHCQMTAATLNSTNTEKDVPQAGCYPPSKMITGTEYTLELAWIQDWSDASGISRMAVAYNTMRKWVSFLLDTDDATTVVTAEVSVGQGAYGGTFGEVALATASWPIIGTPDFPAFTPPVVLASA